MFKNIISALLMTFAFSESFAMINTSNAQPVPGFYSINDQDEALTMVEISEGNHIRIYDRRPSDHVVLIEGTFKIRPRPDSADFIIEVKIGRQRSMDGIGNITDFPAKASPIKSVKIRYFMGIMYGQAQISYVHRDDHTSADEGLVKPR